MKKYLFVIFLSILFTACQKESSNPVDNGKNPYLNGNSEPKDSYFPTSKGTWWKYSGILQGKQANQTITCTNEKQIDGGYYATLINDANGTSNEAYLRVQNNEYSTINFVSNYGAKKEFEMVILKADKPVGEKWTSGILNNNGTDARYKFETIEKNGSYNVAGKNFTNVIVVKVIGEMIIPTTTEWMEFATWDYYFALGVGFIKGDYGSMGTYELVDYSIK